MCQSMVNIQSPTAEIWRGKKRRKKKQDENIIWSALLHRATINYEDIARQSCAMVSRWRFLASFLRPVFPASRVQHISDLHSTFALRHTMCGSMVDIQSATAEIRRGKKEEYRRKKPQGKNIMSASVTQGGHNKK